MSKETIISTDESKLLAQVYVFLLSQARKKKLLELRAAKGETVETIPSAPVLSLTPHQQKPSVEADTR